MDLWDGFFGRNFWTDFWTDFCDGNPDDELGTKLLWAFHSIFLVLFGHFQNPHLNFTSVWWQVGRSMSPFFEPDPCPLHTRVTSCTPPSLNLHNVPRALLQSVSLTRSFSIFASFSSSSGARLMLTKRSMTYSRGDLHGGGLFSEYVFFTSNLLCQYAAIKSRSAFRTLRPAVLPK